MIFQNRPPSTKEIKLLAELRATGKHRKFNQKLGEINGKYHVDLIASRRTWLKTVLGNFQGALTDYLQIAQSPAGPPQSIRVEQINFAAAAGYFDELKQLDASSARGNTCYVWHASPHASPPERLVHSFHQNEKSAATQLMKVLDLTSEITDASPAREICT